MLNKKANAKGRLMKKKVIFFIIFMFNLRGLSSSECMPESSWKILFENLMHSLKPFGLPYFIFQELDNISRELKELEQAYPTLQNSINQLRGSLEKAEKKFREERTSYWDTLDSLKLFLKFNNEQLQEIENRYVQELAFYNNAKEKAHKNYWQLMKEHQKEKIFASKEFGEITKDFELIMQKFLDADKHQSFLGDNTYWEAVLNLKFIKKLLSYLSESA